MLSIKNLVFKKKLIKKSAKRYMRLYIVKKVVSKNMVKLKLPVFIRIYLVMNTSRVVRYIKLVKRQKVEESKPIEVNGVEE